MRLALAAALVFIASVQVATASSFGVETAVGGWIYEGLSSPAVSCQDFGTSVANCAVARSYPLSPDQTLTGGATGGYRATAEIGKLGSRASSALTASDSGAYSVVSVGGFAEASFWDTITVFTPTPIWGSLHLSMLLAGKLSAIGNDSGPPGNSTPSGLGGIVVFLNPQYLGPVTEFSQYLYTSGDLFQQGSNPFDIALPFWTGYDFDAATGLWSGPVSFRLELRTSGGCSMQAAYDGSCAVDANYEDTLQVKGLQALDLDGNPLADATWVAASGHSYTSPAATPEPDTLLLVAAGLAALLACGWRPHRPPRIIRCRRSKPQRRQLSSNG